jgi:hypothetical protein
VANIMEALRWLCGAGEVLAPLCRKFARCFPTHDPGQTLLLPSSAASSLLRECIAALPHAVSVLCCDLSTVETRLGVCVCCLLLLVPTGAAASGHISVLLAVADHLPSKLLLLVSPSLLHVIFLNEIAFFDGELVGSIGILCLSE